MALDPEIRQQLIETVRRFVNEVCRPNEQLLSETNAIPDAIVRQMRDLGLFGLSIPEAYGGLGLTMEEEALVILEMGHTSPAFRSAFGTNVGIGSQGIVMFGREDQKHDWLPKLATGEAIASFALTEPDSGSDAGSLKTKAARDGNHYVLNGSKRFITNADKAHIFTVMARTDPDTSGAKGLSAFIATVRRPASRSANLRRRWGSRAPMCATLSSTMRACRSPTGWARKAKG